MQHNCFYGGGGFDRRGLWLGGGIVSSGAPGGRGGACRVNQAARVSLLRVARRRVGSCETLKGWNQFQLVRLSLVSRGEWKRFQLCGVASSAAGLLMAKAA
jgi:hypothetical protein